MHKNLYKAELGYSMLAMLLMKIFRLSEYHVSYKGAAGKAFSAHIPALK